MLGIVPIRVVTIVPFFLHINITSVRKPLRRCILRATEARMSFATSGLLLLVLLQVLLLILPLLLLLLLLPLILHFEKHSFHQDFLSL